MILIEIPTKKQIKAELEYYGQTMQYTPADAIITYAAPEILGGVFQYAAKELLGVPKKYTKGLKSYSRRQQKHQAAKERERLKQLIDSDYQTRLSLSNNRYLTWNKQLKDFLSKVSILDDGKVVATSKQLLQKTLRTSKYSKIETKIKHIVSFLEEYSNYAVVPNEAVKDYSVGPLFEKVHFLEKSLRDFVSSTLGEVHGNDWWLKAIPPDVRENAEKKRKKAAILSPEDISTPLIQFINFADLRAFGNPLISY